MNKTHKSSQKTRPSLLYRITTSHVLLYKLRLDFLFPLRLNSSLNAYSNAELPSDNFFLQSHSVSNRTLSMNSMSCLNNKLFPRHSGKTPDSARVPTDSLHKFQINLNQRVQRCLSTKFFYSKYSYNSLAKKLIIIQ